MDPTVPSPPPPLDDVGWWLSELQRQLLASGDLEDFLQRVTALGAAAMPADTSCVIAVEAPGGPLIVAGSDESALAVGKTDCVHREGPHLEVMNTGRSVYSPDLIGAGRWSAFAIEARARSIRCALSIPIQGLTGMVGVLNLYATRADAYDEDARTQAERFAGTIAGSIGIALKLAERLQLNEDLRKALASRSVIDQAIGVIMAENRCDREVAFDVLRRASHNRNVKLREVAADLVLSITGHPPVPGPFGPRR
jgi:GAF domain-containing protein